MVSHADESGLYKLLKATRSRFDPGEVADLLTRSSETRVNAMADSVAEYIRTNFPRMLDRRSGLSDYRTNPYVLMANKPNMTTALRDEHPTEVYRGPVGWIPQCLGVPHRKGEPRVGEGKRPDVARECTIWKTLRLTFLRNHLEHPVPIDGPRQGPICWGYRTGCRTGDLFFGEFRELSSGIDNG